MRLFTTIAALRSYLNLCRTQPEKLRAANHTGYLQHPPSIGFVPTMGALHLGHLSLIHRARRENDFAIVSIFVNPLQFGPNEDLQRYPRTLEHDQALCLEAGVDALFAPTLQEMYGQAAQDWSTLTQVIPPAGLTTGLCGRSRPGHFQGVATVVTKLLTLVQPDRAYFGQKDAQQLAIIRQLVQDLNLPIAIIGCPIVREDNGLAYSSRNQYLTAEQKQQAAILYRSLQQAERAFQAGERRSEVLIAAVRTELERLSSIQPDYIELVNPKTMTPLEKLEQKETGLLAIAAHLGTTRLIDNICLHSRQPIVAIDGPAGAGKSTVARLVAQALGLLYLDTGAMYRALTWLVLQSGIAVDDEPAIAELVSRCEIELERGESNQQVSHLSATVTHPKVWINQQEVTHMIRSLEVTAQVSAVAAQSTVRQELVRQQQRYGRSGGIVAEGRDIGTFVFPDAELKIFLTASVQERARRRQQDLKYQGKDCVSLDELEQAIYERDQKDSNRKLAPLKKAEDAIEIQTDHLSIAEVSDHIVTLYRTKVLA